MSELRVQKDVEEGRLLASTDPKKKLGLKQYIQKKNLNDRMRWIYNLKNMLNKQQDKVVLKDPQEDGVFRDTVNGEMHEFEEHVEI